MLSNLELTVMVFILAEEANEFLELSYQVKNLKLQSREYTDTGFVINLRLPEPKYLCRNCPESMRLGQEVVAYLGSAKVLAGFVLYVDSGEITGLEGFTYGEVWPEDADKLFDLQ